MRAQKCKTEETADTNMCSAQSAGEQNAQMTCEPMAAEDKNGVQNPARPKDRNIKEQDKGGGGMSPRKYGFGMGERPSNRVEPGSGQGARRRSPRAFWVSTARPRALDCVSPPLLVQVNLMPLRRRHMCVKKKGCLPWHAS